MSDVRFGNSLPNKSTNPAIVISFSTAISGGCTEVVTVVIVLYSDYLHCPNGIWPPAAMNPGLVLGNAQLIFTH